MNSTRGSTESLLSLPRPGVLLQWRQVPGGIATSAVPSSSRPPPPTRHQRRPSRRIRQQQRRARPILNAIFTWIAADRRAAAGRSAIDTVLTHSGGADRYPVRPDRRRRRLGPGHSSRQRGRSYRSCGRLSAILRRYCHHLAGRGRSSVLRGRFPVLSPQRTVLSPQRTHLSLQGTLFSPQRTVLSPQSTVLSL